MSSNPPEEFHKIINDFTNDILTTFPEYSGIVSKWWKGKTDEEKKNEDIFVFQHCTKIFPERFFDILYKNVEIYDTSSEVNTEFLPGIVFKHLWSCEDISDNTRETIWKYLQLILFSVIGSIQNGEELGDTAKLFEAINEDELKRKLEETLENMQNMFDASGNEDAFVCLDESGNGVNMNVNMPSAEELHQHINGMMGGKLGKLAMELAEETANELNLDMENNSNAKDVFQKLFKNPGKLMNMVKNIGDKIDTKIKSGEIKESELISEGMDLLNKMKSMPGMGNMQQMFSQMGIPGLGKNAKVNMGAMEAQLNRNLKTAKMKERMRNKVDAKKDEQMQAHMQPTVSEEEVVSIFSTGEKVERTPRGAKPPSVANKKKKQKK